MLRVCCVRIYSSMLRHSDMPTKSLLMVRWDHWAKEIRWTPYLASSYMATTDWGTSLNPDIKQSGTLEMNE